jgi:glycerol-3-phosphate dehydrogenase
VNVLAIDQGTSATKALLTGPGAEVLGRGEVPVRTRSVGADGVEADPEELFASVLAAGRQVLAAARGAPAHAVALANQGETVLAWDRSTGRRLSPAIVWQDRRSGGVCARLADRAAELAVITGLPLDPYFATPLAFATEAVGAGVRLVLSARVTGVAADGDGFYRLATTRGPLRCRWVVNAASLGSDEVDRMFGGDGFTIRPRRGELIVFDKLARTLIRAILLPVPTARTKGVLVAPTVYGNVLLGPSAEDVKDRCDTATTASGLGSLLAAGRRILPGLAGEEVTSTYAGLRAATEHPDYQIRVDAERRYACAGGIRSTGLSASLGIAEHVVALLAEAGLSLRPRPAGPVPVMPYIGEAGVRPYQDAERIAADPAYGQIVCHCERVSRGEIRDALASPVPPADLGGLRRRTRAMNGRCQGFYCAAAVSRRFAAGMP